MAREIDFCDQRFNHFYLGERHYLQKYFVFPSSSTSLINHFTFHVSSIFALGQWCATITHSTETGIYCSKYGEFLSHCKRLMRWYKTCWFCHAQIPQTETNRGVKSLCFLWNCITPISAKYGRIKNLTKVFFFFFFLIFESFNMHWNLPVLRLQFEFWQMYTTTTAAMI